MRLLLFFIFIYSFLADIQSQSGFHNTFEFYKDNNEIARDIHIVDDGLLVIGIGTKELEYYTYILKLNFDGDTLWSEKHFDVYGLTDKTFIKDSWLYAVGYNRLQDGSLSNDGFTLFKFNLKGRLVDSKKYNLNELEDPQVGEIEYYNPVGVIAWQNKIVVYGMIYEANHDITTEVFNRGLLVFYNEDLSYDTMFIIQPRFESVAVLDAHIDSDSLLTVIVDDDLQVENGRKRLFRGFQKYDIEGHKVWSSDPFEVVRSGEGLLSFCILSNQDVVAYHHDDRTGYSQKLLSFNSDGEFNWEYQLDPNENMDSRKIADIEEATDGHILICGFYEDIPRERQGAYLAKHDRNTGELIWERVYQDWTGLSFEFTTVSENNAALSMKVHESGRIFLVGEHIRLTEFNNWDQDLTVISVDDQGCIKPACGGFEQTVDGIPKYFQMFYILSSWIEQDPTAPEGFYQNSYILRGINAKVDSIHTLLRYTKDLGPLGGTVGELGGRTHIKYGGRKVYQLNEEDTLLLYDFTLDVGDIFQSGYTPYDLEVIDSDTIILLNGAKRRTWTLSCIENPENTLTWIEGIGTDYGMLWPANFCLGGFWRHKTFLLLCL